MDSNSMEQDWHEKLIEVVRRYPVLYNLSNPKYMDTKYKNYIWNKIGKEIGVEGALCKQRWTNIRDAYKKYIKKTITKSGQRAKRPKTYKFHQELEFLRPFLKERQCIENIDIDSEDSDKSDRTEADFQTERNLHSNELTRYRSFSPPTFLPTTTTTTSPSLPSTRYRSFSPPTFSPTTTTTTSQSLPTTRYRSFSPSTFSPTTTTTTSQSLPSPISTASQNSIRPRRVCTSKSAQPTAAAVMMQHLVAANNASSETSHNNPVDAFLLGAISPILKSLPPYELALAKSELFALAQKYEFEMTNVNNRNRATISLPEHQSPATISLPEHQNRATVPLQEHQNRATISLPEHQKRATISLQEHQNRATISLQEHQNRTTISPLQHQNSATTDNSYSGFFSPSLLETDAATYYNNFSE